jgi:large subunit ribosomal protein L24
MNIKSGDKVKILAGKDKGKTGKVLQVFPIRKKASIEGINLLIKHLRPRRQGDKGQRVEFPAPIDISNIIIVCQKCGRAARTSSKVIETAGKKKKYRICKKCNEIIE